MQEREEQPKVGIILLNYCNCRDTMNCVESLEGLDYRNYIVVIVDNSSPDDSFINLKAIENDKIIVIESGTNGGFAFGNNIGIDYAMKAKCDYVLLLNNDTKVDVNMLRELIATAKNRNDVGIVTGKILYGSEPNRIWYAGGKIDWVRVRAEHIGINQEDLGQYDYESEVAFSSGCCMLIPASVIFEIGFLPEDYFMYYEDLDYCQMMLLNEKKIYYNPQAKIFHYISRSSGGNDSPFVIEWSNRSRRRFFRKYSYTLPLIKRTAVSFISEMWSFSRIIFKVKSVNRIHAYFESFKDK